MTPAEILIARQRAQLLRVERSGMADIVSSYQSILRRMRRDLDALAARIASARDGGEDVSRAWLYREQRYTSLIGQLEEHTLDYLDRALSTTVDMKSEAAFLANGHAPKLTVAAMGPATGTAHVTIEATFDRLAGPQLDRLLHNASNGRPLGQLLHRIAPDTVQAARESLAYGIAQGHGPRQVARDFERATRVAPNRALTIARTEMLGAYRETSAHNFRSSPVVTGWTWHSACDSRTCPACWAMHGTEHGDDETLDTHPCCRCTMLPKTKSWAELGFDIPDGRRPVETGVQRFANLPADDQLAILGRRRLDAYNAGEISLEDMVRPTRHPEWGAGRRTATLTELGV